MLNDWFTTEKPTPVDDLIETVLEEMKDIGPSEEEYSEHMTKLERLYALKAVNKPKPVSRDTIIMGAVHLFGILIIVFAEKDTILSRTATGMLPRAIK